MFLTQDLRNRKMAAVIAYINRLSLAGYRPETRRAREKCARSFAQFIHPTPLTKATRADVEAFLARDLKPESRRAYRAHLRGFYAFCLDEGLITEDPTVKVPPIRIPRAAPRPMSGDDLALALDHADPRMRAWLLLMVLAGLRCIEVAHLRPRDLLPTEAGTLLFLRECKGGGSAMVPAHPAVLEALAVLPIRDRLWWDVSPQRVVFDAVGSGTGSVLANSFGEEGRPWYFCLGSVPPGQKAYGSSSVAVVRRVDPDAVDEERLAGLVQLDRRDPVEHPAHPRVLVVGRDRDDELVSGVPHLVGPVAVRLVGEDVQHRVVLVVVPLEPEALPGRQVPGVVDRREGLLEQVPGLLPHAGSTTVPVGSSLAGPATT
jgi:hypothetical protein